MMMIREALSYTPQPIKDPKGGFAILGGLKTRSYKYVGSALIPGLLPAQLANRWSNMENGKRYIQRSNMVVDNKFD